MKKWKETGAVAYGVYGDKIRVTGLIWAWAWAAGSWYTGAENWLKAKEEREKTSLKRASSTRPSSCYSETEAKWNKYIHRTDPRSGVPVTICVYIVLWRWSSDLHLRPREQGWKSKNLQCMPNYYVQNDLTVYFFHYCLCLPHSISLSNSSDNLNIKPQLSGGLGMVIWNSYRPIPDYMCGPLTRIIQGCIYIFFERPLGRLWPIVGLIPYNDATRFTKESPC